MGELLALVADAAAQLGQTAARVLARVRLAGILQQMLKDLKPFFLFLTFTDILLACLFVILNPDIG